MIGMLWKKPSKKTNSQEEPKLRRDRKNRRKKPAKQAGESAWEDLKRKSDALRHFERIGLLDKAGFYEIKDSLSRSTTVQMAGMQLAVSGAPTSQEGLLVGIDAWSMWPVMHDVFEAYNDPSNALSSPNCVVIGDIGKGKSSLIKTWAVVRQLLLGRRVVVIDKKWQATETGREGEYVGTARSLGYQPIQFKVGGGGSCINVLDPAISSTGAGVTAGQQAILEAIGVEATGRKLTSKEKKALRVARKTAIAKAAAEERIADIGDVLAYLFLPDAEIVDGEPGVRSIDELREWGLDLAFDMEVLVNDELRGLIDGPTSEDLDLQGGLMVFDISALPDEGPAIPIIMAVINTWLRSTIMAREDTVPTIFVIEEGWHIVEGAFAKVTQKNQKLARGLAFQNVTALQHISDIDERSPAISTIKEAETVFVFGQRKTEDAEACARMLNWPPGAVELIQHLPQGSCLLQIANQDPILVTCMRSSFEVGVANTDAAMASTATTSVQKTMRDVAAPAVDHSRGTEVLDGVEG